MPSIIPPLTPPAIAPNVLATIEISTHISTAETDLFYSAGLIQSMYMGYSLSNSWTLTVTNRGTMWADGTSGATLLRAGSLHSIANSGTMVARATDGMARAIIVESSLSALHNSGNIVAIGTTNAVALADWSSSEFFNSGTIAAQGVQNSTAMSRANGGPVVNSATGRILSESADAVALYMGRGHSRGDGSRPDTAIDVSNAGLIEARSTGNDASVAILLSTGFNQHNRIVNSGTIRGDFAIYGDGTSFSPAAHGTETVINEAGGLIEGAIFLGLGNDVITNRGTIHGFVAMAEGDDLVDTRDGVMIGGVDLGWGEDTFLGGASDDAVTGNRGDDTLHGGGGTDLLMGGYGNDTLEGGAGNDGLYGEGGDDRIVTSGGDRVDAGRGDDRIELGDYSFASIQGGAGHDILVLPADGRVLDLQAVAAAARIDGIEEIRLGTGGSIIVRADDVAAISGADTLVLSSAGSGTVNLAGAWTMAGAVTQRGVTYTAYTSAGATVLVGSGLTVASPSTPAGVGLDAIAGGGAAAVPGAVPGVDFAATVTIADRFALMSNLTIDAVEHWRSSDGSPVFVSQDSANLINYGRISSFGVDVANAISVYNIGVLANYGLIETAAQSGTERLAQNRAHFETYGLMNGVANLQGNVNAVYAGSNIAQFRNEGDIRASSVQAFAVGHQNWQMRDSINSGNITATSSHFIAVGVYAHNGGMLINDGTISATGGWGAYGFGASTHRLHLINTGTIRADATEAGRDAIGVDLYYQSGWQRIENSGLIAADIAIRTSWNVNGGNLWLENSGRIEGRIELNVHPSNLTPREDVILNSGTIVGNVSMGGERDIFYGRNGVQDGTVFGGDGGDWLVGGSGRDRLNGGNGDDVLQGGGGDTLTGGAGRDTFVFDRLISGSAAETITDFVSGVDRIDVSSLNPTGVAISGTRVTVTTASGTLIIDTNAPIAISDIITARIETIQGTAGSDTLVATGGGSTLIGGDGFDLLIGGAGNDRLEGGAAGYGGISEVGNMMWGGAGDDVYVSSHRGDQIVEFHDGGFDTLIAGTNEEFTLPDHVEAFIGAHGVGNALDNVMTGTDGEYNRLDGGAGSDRLIGLGGNDHYIVDTQGDIIFENPNGGIDLVETTVSFQLYANVENLRFSWEHDIQFGVGNDLDNVIEGNHFDNLLIGLDGNDTLRGGGGIDSLFGMDGADQLFGDYGIDYLVGGAGNDTLDGGEDADALYGEDGDDILIGGAGFHTDILVGGAGNDVLRGDSGLGDYDRMDGGAGDDAYYVDTPDDLTFEAANGGTDTVYATINGAGYYLYANVENLVLGGNTPFGVGNELDNRITGSAASNWLLGGAGNDVLNGGAGNDVLFGEAGADIFVFERGTGGDVIGDFVAGTDRIDLSAFGFTSYAQVEAVLGEQGGTAFLTLGNGDLVVLNGVARTALSARDFILATASSSNAVQAEAEDQVPGARLDVQAHGFDAPRLLIPYDLL